MKLEQDDREAIIEIVAARYFSQQNWKWVSLKRDINKIFKAYDELNQQYIEYPYMSRDWYVANSSTKSTHMCEKWNEFKEMVDFLTAYAQYFDFMVKNTRKSFCIASENKELTAEQKYAISAARRLRCNVFVFTAEVPGEIEFELAQIGGGI